MVGPNGVRALADGTAIWTGRTCLGQDSSSQELIEQGIIERIARDGDRLWSLPLGAPLLFGGRFHPTEAIHAPQLTPDNGILISGTLRPLEASPAGDFWGDTTTSVAEIDPAGELVGVNPLGWWFDPDERLLYPSHIAVAGDAILVSGATLMADSH